MPAPAGLTDAKRKLLEVLKRHAPMTVSAIADAVGVTPAAAHQHLTDLEQSGLVTRSDTAPVGRGRPAHEWELTQSAAAVFPDRHSDLTVELIDAIREAVGEEGLDRVIDARQRRQLDLYQAVVPPEDRPLPARVQALADRRTFEGYMAEVRQEDDGSCLLIEHHCPICDAATSCAGLCRAELNVFQGALGDSVTVEREQHLLAGDARCVYRIRTRR